MKKLYLPYLFLLLPVLTFAQHGFVLQDAFKKAPGIISSAKIDDHLGVYQVNVTDTSFTLMAIDDKMIVLWRDTLLGQGVACGKFNNKILAISDSANSNRRGNINPYYAYLIDPASGKVLLQNKIFQHKAKHDEAALAFFTTDGSDFKLVIKQADINYSWLSSYKNRIEDLIVVSLNEQLRPTFFNPKFPDEDFLSFNLNNSGDIFLVTWHDKSVQVRRYDKGSTEPSAPITLACNPEKNDLWHAPEGVAINPDNRDILYLCMGSTNQDDDHEVITAKFNFAAHDVKTVSEVFTHKHIKEVEKSFVPVNDFKDANLGAAKKQLRVQYARIKNNNLVTVSAEDYFVTMNSPYTQTTTYYGGALVINGYDSDLKPLYQQVMPVGYAKGIPLTTGYSITSNELNIVSNSDFQPVVGQMDLITGKWLKLVPLDGSTSYSERHIIYFNNTLIVPCFRQRLLGSKNNIDLVLSYY